MAGRTESSVPHEGAPLLLRVEHTKVHLLLSEVHDSLSDLDTPIDEFRAGCLIQAGRGGAEQTFRSVDQ